MYGNCRTTRVLTGLAVAVISAGLSCTTETAPTGAVAEIAGTAGSALKGTATFTPVAGGGVKILIDVQGAPPGQHGVHIHEAGDCSAADFASAKGHFNPDNKKHGLPGSDESHAGDLGNMEVKADGTGKLEITSSVLTVAEGKYSVVGKAIIVHEKPDDGGQPTGNAGGRIGCGVIKKK